MFPKKIVMIAGLILLIVAGIIFLSIAVRNPSLSSGAKKIAIAFLGPFQGSATQVVRSARNVWKHYFSLVSTAKENDRLKKELSLAVKHDNLYKETKLSNERLRKLLNFKKSKLDKVVAAEVISKDPSTWFKTIIIDKGEADNVSKGMPVVVHEGIAGQIVDTSPFYSKVLLIIDQNSAVDALVQRSRATGIIKGRSTGYCVFDYVLRKHDVHTGDIVVTSGLDGVYPKGLRIGHITEIVRRNSGMFQEVTVEPFVDFEKLEEVLIVLHSQEKGQAKK